MTPVWWSNNSDVLPMQNCVQISMFVCFLFLFFLFFFPHHTLLSGFLQVGSQVRGIQQRPRCGGSVSTVGTRRRSQDHRVSLCSSDIQQVQWGVRGSFVESGCVFVSVLREGDARVFEFPNSAFSCYLSSGWCTTCWGCRPDGVCEVPVSQPLRQLSGRWRRRRWNRMERLHQPHCGEICNSELTVITRGGRRIHILY